MICRTNVQTWLIEPGNQDDREYARLHVEADDFGLNIDGQGYISWVELVEAYRAIEDYVQQRN